MKSPDLDVPGAAVSVANVMRRASRGKERLEAELRVIVDSVPERSYSHGAADALLAVLEHAWDTAAPHPSDLPFERGSLAARLLLEIASGVQGANTDLAERLDTDKTQLSRAGRRLRQLGLAECQRDGRLNRWTVTSDGTVLAGQLRRQ